MDAFSSIFILLSPQNNAFLGHFKLRTFPVVIDLIDVYHNIYT